MAKLGDLSINAKKSEQSLLGRVGWNVNIHRPNSLWRQLLTTSPISSLDYHFQSKQDQKWLRISQINLCLTSFFWPPRSEV